jgi:hypothetical protein
VIISVAVMMRTSNLTGVWWFSSFFPSLYWAGTLNLAVYSVNASFHVFIIQSFCHYLSTFAANESASVNNVTNKKVTIRCAYKVLD